MNLFLVNSTPYSHLDWRSFNLTGDRLTWLSVFSGGAKALSVLKDGTIKRRKERIVFINSAVDIPTGTIHRLENRGTEMVRT